MSTKSSKPNQSSNKTGDNTPTPPIKGGDEGGKTTKETGDKGDLPPKKPAKTPPAKTPKAKTKELKVEELKGSIDPKYKVTEGEEHLVHYQLTDFSAPRPKDMNEEFTPPKRIVKVAPHMFVSQFADAYTANEAFKDVDTPCKVLAIALNLEKKHVEEAYQEDIASASNGKGAKVKADYVGKLLKSKKKLKLQGSNQICTSVMHIPQKDESFPFSDVSKFPEDCMY